MNSNLRYRKVSDSDLILDYNLGNKEAIKCLINRHKNRIYGYIYHLSKNRELSNDIFQETFIKIIKSIRNKKYQEKGKFISWALRIAHNVTIDFFKKKQIFHESINDNESINEIEKIRDLNCSESDIIKKETILNIRQIVRELPDNQKEVIILRHYYDMSFKEISEKTNTSINTILGRMRYAIINIRRIIKERNMSIVE